MVAKEVKKQPQELEINQADGTIYLNGEWKKLARKETIKAVENANQLPATLEINGISVPVYATIIQAKNGKVGYALRSVAGAEINGAGRWYLTGVKLEIQKTDEKQTKI